MKRRILIGTYALSSGYYDAYYVKAQKARTLFARDFRRAFETCDLIASPGGELVRRSSSTRRAIRTACI